MTGAPSVLRVDTGSLAPSSYPLRSPGSSSVRVCFAEVTPSRMQSGRAVSTPAWRRGQAWTGEWQPPSVDYQASATTWDDRQGGSWQPSRPRPWVPSVIPGGDSPQTPVPSPAGLRGDSHSASPAAEPLRSLPLGGHPDSGAAGSLELALLRALQTDRVFVTRPDGLVHIERVAQRFSLTTDQVRQTFPYFRRTSHLVDIVEHHRYGTWVRACGHHQGLTHGWLLATPPAICLDCFPPGDRSEGSGRPLPQRDAVIELPCGPRDPFF